MLRKGQFSDEKVGWTWRCSRRFAPRHFSCWSLTARLLHRFLRTLKSVQSHPSDQHRHGCSLHRVRRKRARSLGIRARRGGLQTPAREAHAWECLSCVRRCERERNFMSRRSARYPWTFLSHSRSARHAFFRHKFETCKLGPLHRRCTHSDSWLFSLHRLTSPCNY